VLSILQLSHCATSMKATSIMIHLSVQLNLYLIPFKSQLFKAEEQLKDHSPVTFLILNLPSKGPVNSSGDLSTPNLGQLLPF
jgi:hypothetical protein